MTINRLLTNICCENLPESTAFYTALFDFQVDFESDWFMHLISEEQSLELGLIEPNHPVVPEPVRGAVKGVYITLVVDDVNKVYTEAQAQKCSILQAPEPTDYGQMRMLLKAPEGTIVDVSSPTA